jgi:hypothetical protein
MVLQRRAIKRGNAITISSSVADRTQRSRKHLSMAAQFPAIGAA